MTSPAGATALRAGGGPLRERRRLVPRRQPRGGSLDGTKATGLKGVAPGASCGRCLAPKDCGEGIVAEAGGRVKRVTVVLSASLPGSFRVGALIAADVHGQPKNSSGWLALLDGSDGTNVLKVEGTSLRPLVGCARRQLCGRLALGC